MSITVEEYEEVLNAEVWVEVNKLRDYARHGISREVRGEVWLYLLGIQEADRSKEVSTQKQKLHEYEQIDKEPNEMTKRVRGEISRYLRKTNIESSRNMPRLFEDIISAFCNHNHRVEYYPAMVNLCAPFVYSVKRECDAFLCFEKMINLLEEEVDIKEWAASALQFVLSRELSLENTMRLWDTYFSDPDWIELHPFFCLAVLKHLKESLEELEQSEIRTMLMRLPTLDMDQIVNEAFNLRHEIRERQISDEGL
ncbi:MAG: rab-GTPase-TBC domain-containing protein [Podila humilis]|nr:MAG: rab-GTPase-TBC domain-containing protein [Podila humilis]